MWLNHFFHVHVLPRVLFKKDNPTRHLQQITGLYHFKALSAKQWKELFSTILYVLDMSGHSSVCHFLETYPIIVKYK